MVLTLVISGELNQGGIYKGVMRVWGSQGGMYLGASNIGEQLPPPGLKGKAEGPLWGAQRKYLQGEDSNKNCNLE